MSLKRLLLIALMMTPVMVGAQTPPKNSQQATLDAMQTNVAKISEPAEKDRWQSNASLWRMNIARTGPIAGPVLAPMQTAFDAMKANVAKIPAGAEKNRWQQNCALWQALLAKPTLAKGDVDDMNTTLGQLKANIAKITEAGEKARWQANYDLWRGVVAQN